MLSYERKKLPKSGGCEQRAGAAFCLMSVEGVWHGMSSYCFEVLEDLGTVWFKPVYLHRDP